jgi:hypothetical protein
MQRVDVITLYIMGQMNKKQHTYLDSNGYERPLTVGMPVTVTIGSDRYAGSIKSIGPSGNTMIVSYHDGGAELRYLRRRHYVTSPSSGLWKEYWKTRGRNSGYGLYIGKAENYYDPSY